MERSNAGAGHSANVAKRYALTVPQPFADAIAAGDVWIEGRNWSRRFEGPLAIHAARTRQWFGPQDETRHVVFGAIVAVVDVVAIVHNDVLVKRARDQRFAEWPICAGTSRTWREAARHVDTLRDSGNKWFWIFARPRRVDPFVAVRGCEGLWDVPPDVVELVRASLARNAKHGIENLDR